MSVMTLLFAASWAGVVGVNAAPSAVELKPAAIALDSPPNEETQRSCVLYDRGGGMNVLSAAANDPAIGVDLREGSVPGLWVVTATLPAGYRAAGKESISRGSVGQASSLSVDRQDAGPTRNAGPRQDGGPTPHGRGSEVPVEILVQTDLPGESVICIPVRVWAKHSRPDPAWLERAKALIGRPAPMAVLNRLHGGQVEIGTEPGKVTAVVFSAHWCGHCGVQVPIIEKVAKEYMSRDVRFVGVAGSSGSDVAVEESVATWGVTWPVGVDYDRSVLTQYGVRAFPVVFLIDREGIVQAVHGRVANTEKHNGLDNLETELRGELDLLLLGRTRADFPKVEASPKPEIATRPAAERPAGAAVKVAEVRAATCKPGATAVFSVPVRNVGMRPLNLLKVGADEGVKISPAAVKEVAPNGVAMLRCEVVAPAQAGPFSCQVTIETNDPRTPVVKIALSGTVSERRVAAGTYDQTADSAPSACPLMPTQLDRETTLSGETKGCPFRNAPPS